MSTCDITWQQHMLMKKAGFEEEATRKTINHKKIKQLNSNKLIFKNEIRNNKN